MSAVGGLVLRVLDRQHVARLGKHVVKTHLQQPWTQERGTMKDGGVELTKVQDERFRLGFEFINNLKSLRMELLAPRGALQADWNAPTTIFGALRDGRRHCALQ